MDASKIFENDVNMKKRQHSATPSRGAYQKQGRFESCWTVLTFLTSPTGAPFSHRIAKPQSIALARLLRLLASPRLTESVLRTVLSSSDSRQPFRAWRGGGAPCDLHKLHKSIRYNKAVISHTNVARLAQNHLQPWILRIFAGIRTHLLDSCIKEWFNAQRKVIVTCICQLGKGGFNTVCSVAFFSFFYSAHASPENRHKVFKTNPVSNLQTKVDCDSGSVEPTEFLLHEFRPSHSFYLKRSLADCARCI